MHAKRGIVLVTVLFFILLIGILSRAILSAGPLVARVGGQLTEALVAQRAAEAGAGYACAQMKAKNDWRGDKNATTINQPDLKVVEDNGNVVGWMKNASGAVSMFRIRFNFQDGTGNGDGGVVEGMGGNRHLRRQAGGRRAGMADGEMVKTKRLDLGHHLRHLVRGRFVIENVHLVDNAIGRTQRATLPGQSKPRATQVERTELRR